MAFKGRTQVWRRMTARIVKIVSKWYISGTEVTASAAEINKLDGVTATTTELNKVAGVTAGTVTASKAVVVDANKKVDVWDPTILKIGGTEILRTAGQLNVANRRTVVARVDAVTPGDMTAKISVLAVTSASTLQNAYLVPDAAFSTAADAFSYELINAGTDGGGTASIGEVDLSGAVANLVAYKPVSFGSLASTALAASGAVALQVKKKGNGTDSKAGVLVLELTQN